MSSAVVSPPPTPDLTDLPPYEALSDTVSSSRRPRTEHEFSLDGGDKPWLTLKVFSHASSPSSIPVFIEDDTITGSVEIDVSKLASVQEITLSVVGTIILVGQVGIEDPYTFLRHLHPLYSKLRPPASSGTRQPFPFSFKIPSMVQLMDLATNTQVMYKLPQSFTDRLTTISVSYKLCVHIRRGRFRPDDYLLKSMVYIPCIRPDPPSQLRRLAYQEDVPLLGPELDPGGWRKLDSFTIRGTLFNVRSIEATITLFLATPLTIPSLAQLSYTRGTTIPCTLTIECADAQALDLLSLPTAPSIWLQRRVKDHAAVTLSQLGSVGGKSLSTTGWSDHVVFVESAVWWVPPAAVDDRVPSDTRRTIEGEFHLAKNLIPSSAMAHFAVQHSVVVLPFEVAGFAQEGESKDHVSLAHPVEIGTIHAKGPKPRAFAPPGYSSTKKKPVYYIGPASGLADGWW